MNINSQHRLEGDGTSQIPCPKATRKFRAGALDSAIIHYTVGSTAKGSANYLASNRTVASAHVVIGRDGHIFQIVPFDTRANHAGKSEWEGRQYMNQYSIGIELDNAGWMTKSGNEYVASFKKRYPETEVIKATHANETKPRYWHDYTEKQMDACRELCFLLKEKYNIKLILGHDEISPGRKQDPGPAFPMDKFRNEILSDERAVDKAFEAFEGKVKAKNSLNIRAGGGGAFEKIAKPLANNTPLKIIDEENGWYKVKVEIEGWVSKGFVQKK